VDVTITRPVRRRPIFHPLPVAAVERMTDDSVAVTFAVAVELRGGFGFQAGQHLTVRRIDPRTGTDVRRSYSICSTPTDLAEHGRLRIGVKEIPGGAFSRYAATVLRPGDTVEVLPPVGHFTTAFDPRRGRHYAAVAAGSGITPVLSLLATALSTEVRSRFTLIYGNRSAATAMFTEEIADLKDRFPTRLQVVHVLSREPLEAELLSGRIDADRFGRLLDAFLPPDRVDEWFLCGPHGMVTGARQVLAECGVARSLVHTELFHVAAPEQVGPEQVESDQVESDQVESERSTGTAVTVLLDGRTSMVRMDRSERVLDAALRVRGELPYACRGGVCSTCRAKVLDGEVSMARNYALEPDEIAAGYVLTCQASPLTDRLTVDYDA